jgi:hypothetical protein
VSARTLVKGLLVAGLLLLIVSLMMRSRLPDQGRLSPELLREPEQTAVQEAPIKRTVGGVDYTIKPLYAYDLTGLVVSRHDSDTWWDYIHREWNDHLNVVDLCVVWGDNVANGSYRKQSFSSGQFVCYWQAPSAEAFAAFNPYKISNNHIITDDHRLAKKFRTVRVGDQGRFRGFLAEYAHRHKGQPFHRGTSTTRMDTGNSACETVYVTDLDILNRGGGLWHAMVCVAWAVIALSIVWWFRLPISQDH